MSVAETYRNGRVVLDLTMSADRVVRIDEMNGHQGENGRVVKFAMVGQNGLPEDISNKTIDLVGVDSAGKTKISGNTATIVNPSMGWFDFTIPSVFYQKVGDYDRAYFRVKDNDSGNVSTVNVMLSVIQGVGYLTQGDSQIYNGNVDSQMAAIEQKVATFTKDISGMLDGTTNAAQIARESLNAVLQAIQTNQVPTLGGNNTFTGQNTFKGTVSMDNLTGGALQKINSSIGSQVNALKSSLQDSEQGRIVQYNAWGVNGTKAHGDVQCKLIKFNKHVGYCFLEGTFDFPPMKPYETKEVINVDPAAMNGGQHAQPLLVAPNAGNILYFHYLTGDSGKISMDHQGTAYDQNKSDPEFIQLGWWCVW